MSPKNDSGMKPDASLEAVPKPDLSIGSDPTAATGVGVYPPTAQSIAVLSRRASPVTIFAKVANEGLLPDAIKLRGSGGSSLFAVSNTTAVGMAVTITPTKRLLTKRL